MMMQMQRQLNGFELLHTTHAAVIPISNTRELMGSGTQGDGLDWQREGYLDIHPSHGRSSWYRMRCCALHTISSGHSDTPPENAPGLLARCSGNSGGRRGLGCPAVRAICGSAAPLGAARNGRVLARAAALSPCISAPVPASSRAPQSWFFLALLSYIAIAAAVRTMALVYGQAKASRPELQIVCGRAPGAPDTAAVGPYLVRNSPESLLSLSLASAPAHSVPLLTCISPHLLIAPRHLCRVSCLRLHPGLHWRWLAGAIPAANARLTHKLSAYGCRGAA